MMADKTKGATGPGKGFSTSGRGASEDSPGFDPRIQGNRRYGKGALLPGGKHAGVDHGVHRLPNGKPDASKNMTSLAPGVMKRAAGKRLGFAQQDEYPGRKVGKRSSGKRS